MLTLLRRQANAAAQEALHNLTDRYLATGVWDRQLSRTYAMAEQLLDLIDERIRDQADCEPEPWGGLPDIPLADPGDHFAGMPS